MVERKVPGAIVGAGTVLNARDVDAAVMPVTRASALGLPADRVATVFERPHTEASYLTKEMGHVLARKHARRLRLIGLVLFVVSHAGEIWRAVVGI